MKKPEIVHKNCTQAKLLFLKSSWMFFNEIPKDLSPKLLF